MWARDRNCVDEKAPPTSHSQKTMITVFFGVDGITLLDILPNGAKLTSDYFCHNITGILERLVYPDVRAQLAMLLTSIMHLFIKLKKFNRDSMSVSSAD
jgi:hypothetical protein